MERAIEEAPGAVDWGTEYKRAVLVALSTQELWRSPEDFVHDAIERVLRGDPPWDPASGKTLGFFLVAVAKNLARDDAKHRRVVAKYAASLHQESFLSPMLAYEDNQRRVQLLERLVKACAKDPDERRLLDAELDGTMGLSAQMALFGADERTVRTRRTSIGRKLKAIVEELDAAERNEDVA